jgi:hypothetical protein
MRSTPAFVVADVWAYSLAGSAGRAEAVWNCTARLDVSLELADPVAHRVVVLLVRHVVVGREPAVDLLAGRISDQQLEILALDGDPPHHKRRADRRVHVLGDGARDVLRHNRRFANAAVTGRTSLIALNSDRDIGSIRIVIREKREWVESEIGGGTFASTAKSQS